MLDIFIVMLIINVSFTRNGTEKEAVRLTSMQFILADAAEEIPPLDKIPPANSANLAQVCEAIVQETGCSLTEAASTIAWVANFVTRARESRDYTQYPTDEQMSGRDYRIFDRIMPHGTTARPGSAHDLLGRYLLYPAQNETGLWHDQRHDDRPSRVYCTVVVALGVIY